MREHGQRREIVKRNYSGTVKDSVFVKSFIWWSTERERNTVLTVGRVKKIWHPEQGTFLIWFSLDAPILLIRRLDETIKTISFFSAFANDAGDIAWFLSSSNGIGNWFLCKLATYFQPFVTIFFGNPLCKTNKLLPYFSIWLFQTFLFFYLSSCLPLCISLFPASL